MNSNPDSAKTKLTDVSRAKDQACRSAWFLLVLALTLLVFLAGVLMDYWLMLPLGWRVVTALAAALLAGVGMVKFIRLLRRPTSLKEAALDVEGQDPKLGCAISTVAEYLSGERAITKEYEPELVAALEKQAARALEKTALPYWRKLLAPSVLMMAGLAVLLSFVLAASGAFTALHRTAMPWSNAPYTRVEVKPGYVELPVGSDLEIKSLFQGRQPKEVRFHWRDEGSPKWHAVALSRSEGGGYVHSTKEVSHSISYRVTGGDAASPEYQASAYVPPTVKDLGIQLEYPLYTGRKSVAQASPDITIVRGSTASFNIVPSVKLSKARLRCDKTPSVDMTPGSDGNWTANLPITKETDYWIELRDEKNHLGVNDKPYHIKALPDEPPKVEIAEPGQDSRADVTNTLALKISVSDDFGVKDIKLVYHKLGGPEQSVVVKKQSQQGNEVLGTAELPLEPLGLKPYELVAYHAEAVDNNTLDGPGVGKSPLYFVEITNEEGGQCKCQGQGSKVNLLVIQKQIIADTLALATNAPADKAGELAKREEDAVDFGRIYHQSLTAHGAPAEAVNLMNSAISDMQQAVAALKTGQREPALPPEERALANFYQIVKRLPELGSLPTRPPEAEASKPPAEQSQMLKVVLEAIKKQKKEQPDDKEIEQLAEQLAQLSQSQSQLNQNRHPGNSSSPNGQSPSTAAQSKAQVAKPGSQSGNEKSQSGDEKDGRQDSGKEGQNGELAKMAEQQEQLSKEGQALAEKLARLAGKDGRLGHNLGKSMNQALDQMNAAAQSFKSGNRGGGMAQATQATYTLNTLVSLLEKIIEAGKNSADISNEDYPAEFEVAIRDYLKRLSYQE